MSWRREQETDVVEPMMDEHTDMHTCTVKLVIDAIRVSKS